MTLERGVNHLTLQYSDPGYLSDESEFFGDEATISELKGRSSTFNPAEWWTTKTPSLTEIANANIVAGMDRQCATLYNPYEGAECGRQLGESVEEFVQRLPPATTRQSERIPWIFIANPFRKAPTKTCGEDVKGKLSEGPPDENSDWAKFVVLARNLLGELTTIRYNIERQEEGKPKGATFEAINIQKDLIVKKILDTAVELHCTTGKWMIFCQANEVNAVWSVVARATAENDLGIAAKVAPDGGNPRFDRIICIYTKDFSDVADVTRVLRKMKGLGLVSLKERPIYYKCDGFTYLGIMSDNEYGIKVSMYNSADILAGKVEKYKDQKIEGFFYKKEDS